MNSRRLIVAPEAQTRDGSNQLRCSEGVGLCDVRFTPESGHVQCGGPCLLWAKKKQTLADHSITASARASNVSGRVRPRTLAVVRLTTTSNLVGCWTGRSPGFAPRR